jgi:hypothetical protein
VGKHNITFWGNEMKNIGICLIVAALFLSAGCKEKPSKPSTPPSPTAGNSSTPSAPSAPSAPSSTDLSTAAKNLGQAASTAAAAAAQKFTFDPAKSLDTAKAEAAKMDVTQLRAMAQSILAAIKDKQAQIASLTKESGTNTLDSLGAVAKSGGDVLKQAQAALDALKAQFKVYYDALVAKGGDTSGLQLPQ